MPQTPSSDDLSSGEILAILQDERSGLEYYVSPIDTFSYHGKTYAVMYSYVPFKAHSKNEILIMHKYEEENGDTYYSSIRNREEYEVVFKEFFRRYQEDFWLQKDHPWLRGDQQAPPSE